MESSEPLSEVVAWLRENGHTDTEIARIMDLVREYDRKTNTDSIMDAIADGTFDIAAIIQVALAGMDDSTEPEE